MRSPAPRRSAGRATCVDLAARRSRRPCRARSSTKVSGSCWCRSAGERQPSPSRRLGYVSPYLRTKPRASRRRRPCRSRRAPCRPGAGDLAAPSPAAAPRPRTAGTTRPRSSGRPPCRAAAASVRVPGAPRRGSATSAPGRRRTLPGADRGVQRGVVLAGDHAVDQQPHQGCPQHGDDDRDGGALHAPSRVAAHRPRAMLPVPAAVAQLVEHQLPKLRVASSNLVRRSRRKPRQSGAFAVAGHLHSLSVPHADSSDEPVGEVSGREREVEGAAAAGRGLGPDPPAVALDDPTAGGEADPAALVLAAAAGEHLEDRAVVGQADAVVAHRERPACVPSRSPTPRPAAAPRRGTSGRWR